VCYNNATQCCANPATSMVGDRFNGGCYQTPYCRLDYKLLDGSIVSIAGELLPAKSSVQSLTPTTPCRCRTLTLCALLPSLAP
jgi:hypothetical protein